MIGKQVKGRSFRGVLNYLHAKAGARQIGGNMAGATPRTLAAEFRVARDLNPKLKRAVYHASLSLAKTESLEDERWNDIAAAYVAGMGFGESQYVVYRHSDRDHDHIHIVASRIRITDGSTVTDSWDYRRSETVIRELEQQYSLTAVRSSTELESRAPTTGEMRRKWRTGDVGVRSQLISYIEAAAQGEPTLLQFMHRLNEAGVDVRVSYTRTDKVKGISYELDGVAFSGTKLGKAYTFPGLQKHRGIAYDPEMTAAVKHATERPPADTEQQQRIQQAAPILADFLAHIGQSDYVGSSLSSLLDSVPPTADSPQRSNPGDDGSLECRAPPMGARHPIPTE